MRQPIGLYLTDFGAHDPVFATTMGLPRFDHDAADAVVALPPTLPSVPEEIAPSLPDEPFADEGLAGDVSAAVETPAEQPPPAPDLAAVVEALEADHAAALAEARRQWAEQEGATLAAGFAAALDGFATRIADTLAPLLEPFLVEAAQVQALAGLRSMLATLFDSGAATVAVSGPADLLAALEAGGAARPGVSLTVAETPDVTVAAGDTRIRTQLAGWARALQAALEAPAGAPA